MKDTLREIHIEDLERERASQNYWDRGRQTHRLRSETEETERSKREKETMRNKDE